MDCALGEGPHYYAALQRSLGQACDYGTFMIIKGAFLTETASVHQLTRRLVHHYDITFPWEMGEPLSSSSGDFQQTVVLFVFPYETHAWTLPATRDYLIPYLSRITSKLFLILNKYTSVLLRPLSNASGSTPESQWRGAEFVTSKYAILAGGIFWGKGDQNPANSGKALSVPLTA